MLQREIATNFLIIELLQKQEEEHKIMGMIC